MLKTMRVVVGKVRRRRRRRDEEEGIFVWI